MNQNSNNGNNENDMDVYNSSMNKSLSGMQSIRMLFQEQENNLENNQSNEEHLMTLQGLKYSMEYLGHKTSTTNSLDNESGGDSKSEEVSLESCLKMLQLVDLDADGLINFDEFVVTAQNQVIYILMC